MKNATNVGKLYTLTEIHKRLSNGLGRPVILCLVPPTEKVLEFSDHHLQPVMKEGKSFVKDTANFLDKLKDLEEKFFANSMISYYIRRSTQKIS